MFLPVDGYIVLDLINNIDKDCVAFSGKESRAWKAVVHCHNWLARTQPVGVPHHHLQMYKTFACKCKHSFIIYIHFSVKL